MTIQTITSNHELQQLSSSLQQNNEFAIDLEFDRNRYRYGFNLCLMQIYDGDNCYLIDPLSNGLNISEIFAPIENQSVQKVVFAFQEDLRLLHSMGCFPKNLYDLDITTSLLNFDPASLTNLIKEVLDVEVNSSSQQSNWYKRPLTENQKYYAADDVLYLLDFKKTLHQQAEIQGVIDWIAQENSVLDRLDYSDEDHSNLIKEKDKNDLTVFEWHVYCGLMKFFDEEAERLNKPVYHLVSKKNLAELAKNPKAVHRWTQTRGVYGQLKTANFQALLKSVLEEKIEEAEAQNLSTTRKASHNMSDEEYQAMREKAKQINALSRKLFSPIQNKLASEYGKNVQTYILSNRTTKEILKGETELFPDYKVRLLKKYADELNLDLTPYL